jgi:hypothetical protein
MTQLPESIRSLTSLKELRIEKCSTLGLLPDWLGELCSLRSLSVMWTPMMDSLPQSTKQSLVRLEIGRWDSNLKQLPDVIQHLTSLDFLNLTGAMFSCPNLAVPNSLFSTIVYCSISFVFGNNCPIID